MKNKIQASVIIAVLRVGFIFMGWARVQGLAAAIFNQHTQKITLPCHVIRWNSKRKIVTWKVLKFRWGTQRQTQIIRGVQYPPSQCLGSHLKQQLNAFYPHWELGTGFIIRVAIIISLAYNKITETRDLLRTCMCRADIIKVPKIIYCESMFKIPNQHWNHWS